MPRAFSGTYSPDGRRVAYEEFSTAFIPELVRDQSCGGITAVVARIPSRIINLADYSVEKLPWSNSNDTRPDVGRQYYLLPL